MVDYGRLWSVIVEAHEKAYAARLRREAEVVPALDVAVTIFTMVVFILLFTAILYYVEHNLMAPPDPNKPYLYFSLRGSRRRRSSSSASTGNDRFETILTVVMVSFLIFLCWTFGA